MIIDVSNKNKINCSFVREERECVHAHTRVAEILKTADCSYLMKSGQTTIVPRSYNISLYVFWVP